MAEIDLSKDWEAETRLIGDSIKQIVYGFLKKDGVVVGLSGGVDSSVTAALCVKALGPDKVMGVLLPEKESSKESVVLAKEIADKLGISIVKQDISKPLEQLGAYQKIEEICKKNYPPFNESLTYKIGLPGNLLDNRALNFYSLTIEDPRDGSELFKKRLSFADYKALQAALSTKLRMRMIHLYFFAETINDAVAGTTNRTEFELGNFCKYGDGGIDFEVISHLYKLQVYELAKFLDIPEAICIRAPSPDTCSAYVTDEEFFFSLPFSILDRLLFAFSNGLSAEETALSLGLEDKQVAGAFSNFRIKKSNTMHLKVLPPVCGEIVEAFQPVSI